MARWRPRRDDRRQIGSPTLLKILFALFRPCRLWCEDLRVLTLRSEIALSPDAPDDLISGLAGKVRRVRADRAEDAALSGIGAHVVDLRADVEIGDGGPYQVRSN